MTRQTTTEIRGIPGLSGCKVCVIQENGGLYVRKSTEDVEYRARLKNQAAKQQHFYQTNTLPFILIPNIIKERDESCYYSFDMPFFRSKDHLSFFQEATREDLNIVAKHLVGFIEQNIQASPEAEVPRENILAKVREVQERTAKNVMIDQKEQNEIWNETAPLFSELPETIRIPVGRCHGDLTFSNVLINRSDKKLVLIDWLDTFIETPLQDIVKLRQDTKYAWSLQVSRKTFDTTKILLIMEYLDKTIDEHFQRYQFYQKHYLSFQVLNFLRILPYVKERSMFTYLKAVIHAIVNNT